MSGEEHRSKNQTPAAPPRFSFDALQQRLGDDREAAIAVLSAFARDAPNQLARLWQAVKAGDSAEVRLAAHTLKGGLLWIGADEAAASAHALELNSAPGSATDPAALLSSLTIEVEQLLAELRASPGILPD